MSGATPAKTPSVRPVGTIRALESAFLALVCGALFFLGLGRNDFIKTEGLRAIVVAEMLEQPGITMPAIYHRPYVNKPPLYAWVTASLARAVGRFDEQIARLPSALAATALILLLYGAGERAVGRGAGLPTAALALASPTVVDYAVRAELDMGFTLLTTAAMLLAYGALRRRGVAGVLYWMGCYLLATLAAMYKGPHSLIFLWVPLLCYGWRRRDWRWLWQPGQVCGLLASLATLFGWAVALSTHAGAHQVGRIAGMEFVTRLVPLSFGDLASVLYAVPVMAVVLLPGSLFVIASFRTGIVYEPDPAPRTPSAMALARYSVRQFRRWWQAWAVNPFTEFLLYWLGANLLWIAIVPAKSPRYWLPLFAPAFLLAATILQRVPAGLASETGKRHLQVSWRGIYAIIGVLGAAALIAGGVAAIRPGLNIGPVSIGPAWPWVIMGLGWLASAIIEFRGRGEVALLRRSVGLIVVVLAVNPVIAQVWWPARAASDSQRAAAAQIDALVPDGEPVLLLGKPDVPDAYFYSHRGFYWIDNPGEANLHTSARTVYLLLRKQDLQDNPALRKPAIEQVLEFERADIPWILLRSRLDNLRSDDGAQPSLPR